jgi:hypothetical protein
MADSSPEILSPLAREILAAGPDPYGRLVVQDGTPPTARRLLDGVTPARLLSAPIVSADDGRAVLAALWLWHDGLDESHTISQGIETPAGSFWHAIMHRREGDFSNAKYWYARCRHHPALAEIPVHAESVVQTLTGMRQVERITQSGWNADRFVDLVAEVHNQPADPRHAAAVRLQQIEWRVLFEHCGRAAAGLTS